MIRIFDNLKQLSHATAQLISDSAQKKDFGKRKFFAGGFRWRNTPDHL